MEIRPQEVNFIIKTLLQAVARNRVEIYSLRLALVDAGVASLEHLDEARKIAAHRYADLLRIVNEDPQEKIDLRDFLKAFEGPIQ